jgi:hypothetical protein
VQAARLTLVQILMNSKGLAMNPLQSLYYVSPACLMGLALPFGAQSSLPACLASCQFACLPARPPPSCSRRLTLL